MSLPKIRYLEWARARYGRAQFDLATSGVPHVPASFFRTAAVANDPDSSPGFIEALARRYDLPKTEVVPTLGTSQAIWAVYAALTQPGEAIAVEVPGYEPLVRVAEGLGRRVLRFERPFENGWQPELSSITAALDAGARAIVLTDLHNPSGVALSDSILGEIAQRAGPRGAFVIVDEVYKELDPHRTPRTARHVALTGAVGVENLLPTLMRGTTAVLVLDIDCSKIAQPDAVLLRELGYASD